MPATRRRSLTATRHPLARRTPARRPVLRLNTLEDRLAPAANLVADINTRSTPHDSFPTDSIYGTVTRFFPMNGVEYFAADDGTHGWELWRTDGTADGTVLVKDINPGPADAVGELEVVNGTLYFTARDGTGPALWKSDGTAAGTVKVRAFGPGPYGAWPGGLTAAGGRVVFTAFDPAHGWELWGSDGTAAGTRLLRDVYPGRLSSDLGDLTTMNGVAYFTANDRVGGTELWRTDGTAAGTRRVKDVNPAGYSSDPEQLTVVGGTLYFTAFHKTLGRELWKSDGTAAGTVLVKEVYPGPPNTGGPANLTNAGGTLYFTAWEFGVAGAGNELWKTDGTAAGTVVASDANPGPNSSDPGRPVAVNGSVYFTATDGVRGRELYRADGTAAGAVRLTDLPGDSPYLTNVSDLTPLGDSVYFTADDGTNGRELWVSDGTPAGTKVLADLNPGPKGSDPNALLAVGGRLLFTAHDGANGRELWATDGTPAGTGLVRDINPSSHPDSSDPRSVAAAGGAVYFAATDGARGFELWRSDGTPGGTALVAEIQPGPEPTSPYGYLPTAPKNFTAANGLVFFTADNGYHGTELWRTDGTAAGTFQVADLKPGPARSGPSQLTVVGGRLYFAADDGTHGTEVWTTDGTEAGTRLVKDLFPGGGHSMPSGLTDVNGTLYFAANTVGSDLWKSDGTEAGTVPVAPGGGGPSNVSRLTNAGGTLFFTADDGVHGTEVWASDGTPAGTRMVKDLDQPTPWHSPSDLTAVGGRVFFTADDGIHGQEVWVTDGTEAGTHLVKDLVPGSGSSFLSDLEAVGGRLFFTTQAGLWTTDGTETGTILLPTGTEPGSLTDVAGTLFFSAVDQDHGRELWKSDGTVAGTGLLADLVPGPGDSGPGFGAVLGGTMYFPATDPEHGRELWAAFAEPTAAVTLAPGQADPAGGDAVAFDVTFSEPVTGFDAADVDLSASTTGGPLAAAVTPLGPTAYRVEVTGMTGSGQVVARVPAGVVVDAHGHANPASAGGDDTVDFARAGFVGLTQTAYEVTEGGSIVVTARRTGGSAGDVSVGYALTGGSALAGLDFGGESDLSDLTGTFTWLAGQTGDRQVTIPIPADSKSEVRETFTVALTIVPGLGEAPAAGTLTAPAAIAPSDPLHSGAVFTDDDGDTVRLTFTGPGTADVYLSDPDGNGRGPIGLVRLTNTLWNRSALAVRVDRPTVAGPDGVVTIGSVEEAGPFAALRSLSAPRADLAGGISLFHVGNLTVRDIRADATVTYAGALTQKAAITAADVGDGVTIRVGGPISRLQAARIGDGRVEAISLGALVVTGDKARGIPGDFAADLVLTGNQSAPAKPALGSVQVAGTVTGSALEVGGNVGAVKVGAFVDSSLALGGPGREYQLASFTATGLAAVPAQAAFVDSTVTAARIGRVTLKSVGTARPAEAFGVTAGISLAGLSVAQPAFLYSAKQPSPQGLDLDPGVDTDLEFVVRVGPAGSP